MRRIIGSPSLQNSKANQEIVPKAPEGWTVPIEFEVFSFLNTDDCTVILNGINELTGEDNKIFLKAGQGMSINEKDVKVKSCKVVEPNVLFNWIGKY